MAAPFRRAGDDKEIVVRSTRSASRRRSTRSTTSCAAVRSGPASRCAVCSAWPTSTPAVPLMPRAFDSGPARAWEELFAAAPLDHFVDHPSGRFRRVRTGLLPRAPERFGAGAVRGAGSSAERAHRPPCAGRLGRTARAGVPAQARHRPQLPDAEHVPLPRARPVRCRVAAASRSRRRSWHAQPVVRPRRGDEPHRGRHRRRTGRGARRRQLAGPRGVRGGRDPASVGRDPVDLAKSWSEGLRRRGRWSCPTGARGRRLGLRPEMLPTDRVPIPAEICRSASRRGWATASTSSGTARLASCGSTVTLRSRGVTAYDHHDRCPRRCTRRASGATGQGGPVRERRLQVRPDPAVRGSAAAARHVLGRGFTVLGFPCNQFGGQEPGTAEEIQEFCSLNYSVTFPLFEKIEVNGDDRHPLYEALTATADAEGHAGRHPLELREVPRRPRRSGARPLLADGHPRGPRAS